jgi:hypothetical protein
VTLTIGHSAVFGPAGHFYENGTPQAGHEDDYLGACEGDDESTTTIPVDTTADTTTTVQQDDGGDTTVPVVTVTIPVDSTTTSIPG